MAVAAPGIFLAQPEQPAAGVPLAVKDLFDTVGLVTTYGSAIFAEHVPADTAEAVRLLESAGYASVGKTNLHEFAYGTTSENPHYGTVPNPIAPGRIAGGSSGGSAAAVAAGLADVGLGTDSGGSIRIPAACCGVVGFKPTYGLVPLDGCFPLAPSFDHGGPITRTVAACVTAMRALVREFSPVRVESLEEVRIGVAWAEDAAPLVRARVQEAAAFFPRHVELDLPKPYADLAHEGIYALFMREVADVHRELFAEFEDLYGEDVRVKIRRCLEVTDGDVDRAIRMRAEYREQLAELTSGVDLVVTPTCPVVAPPLGRDETGDLAVRRHLTSRTYPINVLGWPALALPCGPAEDGLPASAQIVGRPQDDARVLAVGELLEAALRADARGY